MNPPGLRTSFTDYPAVIKHFAIFFGWFHYSLADPMGEGAPGTEKIIGWRLHLYGWHPSSGKSWIRHCYFTSTKKINWSVRPISKHWCITVVTYVRGFFSYSFDDRINNQLCAVFIVTANDNVIICILPWSQHRSAMHVKIYWQMLNNFWVRIISSNRLPSTERISFICFFFYPVTQFNPKGLLWIRRYMCCIIKWHTNNIPYCRKTLQRYNNITI